MYIAELELYNFVCYGGRTKLKLKPIVYGITAQLVTDERRSNWLGKTTLLSSIDFALTGYHRWSLEDDWITTGEQDGAVMLTLSEGSVIRRARMRGKPTRLIYNDAQGRTFKDAEAQSAIFELIGLNRSDLVATSYFEQKCMSRFMVMQPSKRMSVVMGWIHQLSKLDECREDMVEKMGRMMDGIAAYESRAASNVSAMEEVLRVIDEDIDAETRSQLSTKQVEDKLIELEEKSSASAERLSGKAAGISDSIDKAKSYHRDRKDSVQMELLIEQGKQYKKQLAKQNIQDIEKRVRIRAKKRDVAVSEHGVALKAFKERQKLARGEFDGRCPVGDIKCPATEVLNNSRRRNLKLVTEDEEKLNLLGKAREEAELKYNEASAQKNKFERETEKLDSLREEVRKLAPTANRFAVGAEVPDIALLEEKLASLRLKIGDHDMRARKLREARVRFLELSSSISKTRAHVAKLQAEADSFNEAGLIFKQAITNVAKQALESIQAGANTMLRQADIALSIDVRWEHEGDGLASTCGQCGRPFPASQRIKVCERCAAPRGPKLINKLEIIPSNISGSAEDLAGGAFQLAASAWLRRTRGCSWAVAMLDEPFGALDAEHSDRLSAHISAMLSGEYGFEQAFIVAHTASVMSATPGRIAITSRGGISTATVL